MTPPRVSFFPPTRRFYFRGARPLAYATYCAAGVNSHSPGVSRPKFCDWANRYGKANEHNPLVPRDHWITPEERRRLIPLKTRALYSDNRADSRRLSPNANRYEAPIARSSRLSPACDRQP